MSKVYIDAHSLLVDSFRLAASVFEDDFRPNFIVGIWRGGTPVGIAVQEFLECCGLETDHISIRTSSYTHTERAERDVRVHGMGYIIDRISADDRLLFVDDVFDTGLSIDAAISHLQRKARRNMPEIKIATTYFKPNKNRTDRVPDYYVHESDEWLVFPHEVCGLAPEELREHKPEFLHIFESLRRDLQN